jgi:hypothetical protein
VACFGTHIASLPEVPHLIVKKIDMDFAEGKQERDWQNRVVAMEKVIEDAEKRVEGQYRINQNAITDAHELVKNKLNEIVERAKQHATDEHSRMQNCLAKLKTDLKSKNDCDGKRIIDSLMDKPISDKLKEMLTFELMLEIDPKETFVELNQLFKHNCRIIVNKTDENVQTEIFVGENGYISLSEPRSFGSEFWQRNAQKDDYLAKTHEQTP